MTIHILSGARIPPKSTLIVCAGTVTCRSVAQMGSGFEFFKNFFSNPDDWSTEYNKMLEDYHRKEREIPIYQTLTNKKSGYQGDIEYFGGIATVAVYSDPNKKIQRALSSHLTMKYKGYKTNIRELLCTPLMRHVHPACLFTSNHSVLVHTVGLLS